MKNSTAINMIGFLLSMMAGWIDTIGIELFLNEDAAFMTGRVKKLGYYIANLDFKLFLGVVLIITAFIMGSFISTIITKRAGLKGGLIFTGILIIISSFPISFKYININMIFLPMGMGCQNATTSLTPIDRTTHLTGAVTDLGINLAKRNWKQVMFLICHLMGFPLGSFIGFNLASMAVNSVINTSIILTIPAIIIMLTGIIQERIFNIPLLDEMTTID